MSSSTSTRIIPIQPFSKHENRFLAYDSTYVAGFGGTAAEIAAMAGTLNTLGVVVQLNAVEDRYHSLLPAFTKIGDWYQELRDQVKDQLSVAGFTESSVKKPV